MKPPVRDPGTREEWQNACDICTALRAIADSEMDGLLEGDPEIVLPRVDELLVKCRRLGIKPSAPDADLAAELVAQWNNRPGAVIAHGPECCCTGCVQDRGGR